MRRIAFKIRPLSLWLLVAVAVFPLSAQNVPFALPLLWTEEQRAFVQDGPGLLLDPEQLEQLLSGDTVARALFIDQFLAADPLPETPQNELLLAIRTRRALAQAEALSLLDARAQLLFLHGPPSERLLVDCAEAFQPLELWTYPPGTVPGLVEHLVLYRPKPKQPYQLWRPIDSKRVLYNSEMEYWLEQWEELKSRISGGRRFDRAICEESKRVDEITGVDGLFGFLKDRPLNADVEVYLQPPADLAAWARRVASEEQTLVQLPVEEVKFYFPERKGQRLVTRIIMLLPAGIELEPVEEGEKLEVRLVVEGHLEHEGEIFETFRVRYLLSPPEADQVVALQFDRRLRPGQEFLLRMRLKEETTGRQRVVSRGFVVPSAADPTSLPPVPESALLALGDQLKELRLEGFDSLILVPPETDLVFGLWRAEVLVTGERITRVDFLLDAKKELSRRRPPFTAELRLQTYPAEQTVRVEGYDDAGELVAADEVVLNQPRGELQVRILEPARGAKPRGKTLAKAEVVVPEERKVVKVEFSLNEELQATVTAPPWQAEVEVQVGGDLTYLTVVAELDDGRRAEEVRFLHSPQFLDEVDVHLVELYTTVTDRSGRLARGVTPAQFEVFEDDRPQKIAKFELVEDLPMTLGIVIDTSGSMFSSLGEAQRAAIGFLENIITPKDRTFAMAFADRPVLLMPRTSDVGAVAERLQDLIAYGATSLHDAVVTSLYYYRGIRGRRALVLLSDGEDTASSIEFKDALEYARRSGVAIYSIGLGIGKSQVGVRRKLEALSSETGGRAFYIKQAAELVETYAEIEEELRSQYLVAYNSDQSASQNEEYRRVEVRVRGGKLKARTIRGYYP